MRMNIVSWENKIVCLYILGSATKWNLSAAQLLFMFLLFMLKVTDLERSIYIHTHTHTPQPSNRHILFTYAIQMLVKFMMKISEEVALTVKLMDFFD